MLRRSLLMFFLTLAWSDLFLAQEKNTKDSLAAKWVTLKGDLTVAEALADLQKQTKIAVPDERIAAKDAKINLDLDRVGFWRALDAIATKAGAGVSLYHPKGLALVDGKSPVITPSYASAFRGTLKKLNLSHDFETGTKQLQVGINIAWEPWFKPFYLGVKSYQASVDGKMLTASAKSFGQTEVHGKRAADVDLRFDTPPRSAKEVQSLQGELSIIGPEKMLEVTFEKLVAKKQEFDGVTVSLDSLTTPGANLWQAKMTLTQPAGGPEFESFQSWLTNNKMYLENKAGVKFDPLPVPGVEMLNSRQAILSYYFNDAKSKVKLGKPADWNLVYHTPGRILDVRVPFEFKNIPLP